MKKFILLAAVILLVALASLIYQKSYSKSPSLSLKPSGTNSPTRTEAIEILTKNLQVPWSLVFLPDERLLVTERSGDVKILGSKGDVVGTALSLNVYRGNDTEGGLLGMTLDPGYSSNHYVYLYYTYTGNGNQTLNRVSKFKFEEDKLTSEQILVDKIPGALYHNGGRIKFGPDGYLYITTGDSESPSLAQNKNSLAGKVLRTDGNGKPAPGNSFGTLVYSYGHRNPQGITWDNSGTLWETEHGRSNPTGFDELNIIKPGQNYGWPNIQGDEAKSGMVSPIINSGANGTWAPAGAVYLNGSIFYGGLKGEALYEYKIAQKQLVEYLKNRYGRIRDVELGPDNFLYITTSNRDGRGNPSGDDDLILKVDPAKLQ